MPDEKHCKSEPDLPDWMTDKSPSSGWVEPPLKEIKMPWRVHPHRLQDVVGSLLGAIDIPISHPNVNIEYMEFDSNRLLVQVVLDNGDDSNDFPQHIRLTLTVDDDV